MAPELERRHERATVAEMRKRAPFWLGPAATVVLGLLGTGFAWLISSNIAQGTELKVQKAQLDGVCEKVETMRVEINHKLDQIWDSVRK